jgi:hypothetical protein
VAPAARVYACARDDDVGDDNISIMMTMILLQGCMRARVMNMLAVMMMMMMI